MPRGEPGPEPRGAGRCHAADNSGNPKKAVADFCRRHHIRKLALFGSILRSDFRPDSDIDVLVEFEPGYVPGLAFFAMQEELSSLLGRKVDLNTPASLSRYFRAAVLQEAETLYASS